MKMMIQCGVVAICAVLLLSPAVLSAAPAPRTLGVVFNTGNVQAVAFSPDGKILADGRRYGVEGEENIYANEDKQDFSSTAKHFTGPVRLWDVANGRLLRILRHDDAMMIFALSFSPNGEWLAVGEAGVRGRVKVWDTKTWKVAHTLEVPEANVYKIDFSPDSQRIAVGLGNTSVRLWNIKSQRVERTFWGHDSSMQALSFSPNGQSLALSGNYQDRRGVRIWHVETGKLVRARLGESSVSWEAGGKRFATTASNVIKIWDSASGQLLRQFAVPEPVTQTIFSPDNRWLASRYTEGNLWVWDRKTYKPIYKLAGPHGRTAAVFSPNGAWLASGGWDSTTYIWNLKQAMTK